MNRKNEIDNRIIDFNDIMEDDIDTGIEDIENKYAALDIDAEDESDLVDEVATDMDANVEPIEVVEDESNTVEAEMEADLDEEMEAKIEAEMEAEIAADVKGKATQEDDIEDKSAPVIVKKKKKSKISNIIYNVVRYAIMAVALYVFGYAAYELTLIYVESREAEELKSETSDMFYVSLEDLQEKYEPTTNTEGETISLENANDGKLFVFDYEKMLSYNSHSKGYIRQDEGEYIDNPIVQHPTDNEYYLTHLADHRKSSIGAIYIDSAIKEGLNAKNCIIYGHNINDRAGRIMFGSLNWYWNTTGYYKEHPTFDIWIGNTRYRYYVFATYKTNAVGSPVYQYAFATDEEFMDYVATCKKNSKYTFKTAPEITKDSHIITLSTCTHTKELRMIVQLVRGEELDIYGNPVESETTEQAGVAE